jgi:hypothetical protein
VRKERKMKQLTHHILKSPAAVVSPPGWLEDDTTSNEQGAPNEDF